MNKEELFKNKIIAIIRNVKSSDILNTVSALFNGGIRAVEITFNNATEEGYNNTLECIKIINKNFGDRMYIGAGTVLNEKAVVDAFNAGAKFILSPNVDTKVIKKTKELGMISVPGAITPSEIIKGYNAGADIVKLFPIGNLGVDYVKAISSPINYIPYMAVGGISIDNIEEYKNTGIINFGIGGNLVNLKYIENKDFDKITETAKKYIEIFNK